MSAQVDRRVRLGLTRGAVVVAMAVAWPAVAMQAAAPDSSAAPAPQAALASTRASSATAEPIAWVKLTTEASRGKQDDIAFATPSMGWYVSGARGRIYRTTDAGATWTMQTEKPGTYWRCIAFVDEQRGFAGNIGPDYVPGVTDAVPLYATVDGGATWTPVDFGAGAAAGAVASVKGLCALEVVRVPYINAGVLDEKVHIVGAGRVGGPTVFIRSTDAGATWTVRDMADQAGMLLDVHFVDATTGFLAAATSPDVTQARTLILRTTDGGATWTRVHEGTRPYENVWKLSFPSANVGYGSVQSYDPDPTTSQRFVLKTTDGGATWSELPLVDEHAVRQFGIGFVDESTGWVGAVPGGFATTDGGKTWARIPMGLAGNKVRVVRSPERTDVYSIGVDLWKASIDAERADGPAAGPAGPAGTGGPASAEPRSPEAPAKPAGSGT
jgi:photosystem II stability/assembly factor-like uncharacterized protein